MLSQIAVPAFKKGLFFLFPDFELAIFLKICITPYVCNQVIVDFRSSTHRLNF